MPNDITVQSNNYTLLKLIRTGASPLFGMIGTSAYYMVNLLVIQY
ncbi:hypothetical protein SIXOD_v1c04430 [Spiroplasma ixodetis Y32]|nr:hypothetical protein SIXOD_v1c04430 [Spiroplasma ixodetis Y32]